MIISIDVTENARRVFIVLREEVRLWDAWEDFHLAADAAESGVNHMDIDENRTMTTGRSDFGDTGDLLYTLEEMHKLYFVA